MPLDLQKRFPVMCLTQDGTDLTHSQQVDRLCRAGAGWIQLRMKQADDALRLSEGRQAAQICRRHGAILIINDRVDIALSCGADGVHLGATDGLWTEARSRLRPGMILGGTVNNLGDAGRAAASACLDYVGVGPLRFTASKRNLAPLLGLAGIRGLLSSLAGLPAWAIGGVTAADLPGLRAAGCAGAAVSSSLQSEGKLEENFRTLLSAWESASSPHPEAALLL